MRNVAATPSSAFGPGEEMTYVVRYLGLEAGTAVVTTGAPVTMGERQAWPIVALAGTESVFKLYPVRDKFVTFWDPDTHQTLGSDFLADEGGHRRRMKVVLDHAVSKAHVHRWFEGAPPADEDFDIAPGSFDMAAVAYALREKTLSVGETIAFPVFTGKHSFELRAHVEAAESLTVPAGTFSTLRVGLQVNFLGKFKTSQEMVAWLTDDPHHVPVRIDGSFLLGTLSAELIRYHRGLNGASFPP